MDQKQLDEILEKHRKYLNHEDGGQQAIFVKEDFTGLELIEKELTYAQFITCKFTNITIEQCNLKSVSFFNSDFRNTTIKGCYAEGVNFQNSFFTYTKFEETNLKGANFFYAVGCVINFIGCDLLGANFQHADFPDSCRFINNKNFNYKICPEEGSFIGWKKLYVHGQGYAIAKLRIPKDAERTSCLRSRKCRASKAKILSITALFEPGKEIESGESPSVYNQLFYRVGKTVKADEWDGNFLRECTNGIHFFMTEQEAIDYRI